MDIMYLFDLLCDYIEYNVMKKLGNIYGGLCIFLFDKYCCNWYFLLLFVLIIGYFGLYCLKKN